MPEDATNTTTATDAQDGIVGTRVLTGRTRILANPVEPTEETIVDAISKATVVHSANASDEAYLHNYFLGRQPVLHRKKSVRPEILSHVVENRAYQIAKDRADALAGEPIMYSAHGTGSDGDDETLSGSVQALNDACVMADKHACDVELMQWMVECGVGYRLVLPTAEVRDPDPRRPFVVCSLDPRSTFVVYENGVFREPLWAATYVRDAETGEVIYTAYTRHRVFVVRSGVVESERENPLGIVPIVEYDCNPERMGVFEPALALLDAINEVESNRVDGIAQFVQSLMVLKNVDMDAETFRDMLSLGAVMISSTPDQQAGVDLLTAELNQDQAQTLVDSLYKTVLTICGMPFNVGGSASTSDTGVAVTMRDGWSNSENRCKETEVMFKRAERRFLDIALSIMEATSHLGLSSGDVEIKFTRRNYEAIQSKTQVLTTLLGSGKVAPRLAFQVCGIFNDPEDAYDQSRRYVDEQRELALSVARANPVPAGDEANPAGDGGGDSKPATGDAGGGEGDGGGDSATAQRMRPASTKRSARKGE